MFSTMMTEESTMMPKSTAPMDSRLADLPRKYSSEKANSSASGMLMATISAVRTLLRNMSRITHDQQDADEQVLRDRLGGDVDQVGAVVVGLDLHAGQHAAVVGSFSSSTLALTASRAGRVWSPLRSRTMHWTLSSSSRQACSWDRPGRSAIPLSASARPAC